MRIHTDHLTRTDLYSAAVIARVDMTLTEHGSRSRARAFNVYLTGESRRRPNRQGVDQDLFAATWDQWGVFLAVLFEADAERAFAHEGDTSLMHTPYDPSADTFAARTGDRFGAPEDEMTSNGYRRIFKAHGWPEDAHGDHTFRNKGTPYEQTCTKCSAVERWGNRMRQFMDA